MKMKMKVKKRDKVMLLKNMHRITMNMMMEIKIIYLQVGVVVLK